jgi:hypothetical protein
MFNFLQAMISLNYRIGVAIVHNGLRKVDYLDCFKSDISRIGLYEITTQKRDK